MTFMKKNAKNQVHPPTQKSGGLKKVYFKNKLGSILLLENETSYNASRLVALLKGLRPNWKGNFIIVG